MLLYANIVFKKYGFTNGNRTEQRQQYHNIKGATPSKMLQNKSNEWSLDDGTHAPKTYSNNNNNKNN